MDNLSLKTLERAIYLFGSLEVEKPQLWLWSLPQALLVLKVLEEAPGIREKSSKNSGCKQCMTQGSLQECGLIHFTYTHLLDEEYCEIYTYNFFNGGFQTKQRIVCPHGLLATQLQCLSTGDESLTETQSFYSFLFQVISEILLCDLRGKGFSENF